MWLCGNAKNLISWYITKCLCSYPLSWTSLSQDKEALDRSQTIDDLHNQLQVHMEANQKLNQRVSLEEERGSESCGQ